MPGSVGFGPSPDCKRQRRRLHTWTASALRHGRDQNRSAGSRSGSSTLAKATGLSPPRTLLQRLTKRLRLRKTPGNTVTVGAAGSALRYTCDAASKTAFTDKSASDARRRQRLAVARRQPAASLAFSNSGSAATMGVRLRPTCRWRRSRHVERQCGGNALTTAHAGQHHAGWRKVPAPLAPRPFRSVARPIISRCRFWRSAVLQHRLYRRSAGRLRITLLRRQRGASKAGSSHPAPTSRFTGGVIRRYVDDKGTFTTTRQILT